MTVPRVSRKLLPETLLTPSAFLSFILSFPHPHTDVHIHIHIHIHTYIHIMAGVIAGFDDKGESRDLVMKGADDNDSGDDFASCLDCPLRFYNPDGVLHLLSTTGCNTG